MNKDVIISVEGLGKRYRITHQAEGRRYVALRDVIAEKAKSAIQKLKFGKQKTEIKNAGGLNQFPLSTFPISTEDKAENRKQKTEIGNEGTADSSKFPLSTLPISALASSEDFWALRSWRPSERFISECQR